MGNTSLMSFRMGKPVRAGSSCLDDLEGRRDGVGVFNVGCTIPLCPPLCLLPFLPLPRLYPMCPSQLLCSILERADAEAMK